MKEMRALVWDISWFIPILALMNGECARSWGELIFCGRSIYIPAGALKCFPFYLKNSTFLKMLFIFMFINREITTNSEKIFYLTNIYFKNIYWKSV